MTKQATTTKSGKDKATGASAAPKLTAGPRVAVLGQLCKLSGSSSKSVTMEAITTACLKAGITPNAMLTHLDIMIRKMKPALVTLDRLESGQEFTPTAAGRKALGEVVKALGLGGSMSALDVLDRLKHLTNPQRLSVIETATRLIREELVGPSRVAREQDRRLHDAAVAIKDLYEPGGELAEWTALDGEEFHDESVGG